MQRRQRAEDNGQPDREQSALTQQERDEQTGGGEDQGQDQQVGDGHRQSGLHDQAIERAYAGHRQQQPLQAFRIAQRALLENRQVLRRMATG